jgi:hypothetical protein
MGTITREGGDCRGDDVGSAVVDAEKEDGEAYGGESDVCDWTSGDDTVGEDRFEADLPGHVESLALSLVGGLSSLALGRRTPPVPDSTEDTDLIADAAVDPKEEDTAAFEESRIELPTAAFPEAAIAFDVDDGMEGFVSVRVEDSLDDGELEEGALVCCDVSDEVRERFGRGTFGSGSVGGGELAPDPIRLACAEVGAAAVDGDFKRFEGDVADSAVAVIDCTEAPVEVDAVKLEPPAETALAAVSVRESDAARARSLVGACTQTLPFKVYIM